MRRKTGWRRRTKKAIKRVLVKLATWTVPYIYLSYMWFVYKTSKVERLGFTPDLMREQCGEGIWALWHDEVVFVAYAFGDYRPHTLASKGDFGELVSRMLELCHYTTFRGGSSTSRKRRDVGVLGEMIEAMKTTPGTLWGITVDGSKGPVYRMKKGAAHLAMTCQAPIGVERTWCKRYIRLRTWDGSFVPLPFNHIVHAFQGPLYPPKKEDGVRAFVRFYRDLERRLCFMSGYVRRRVEGSVPEDWVALFPPKFQDAVREDREPELFLPVDPEFGCLSEARGPHAMSDDESQSAESDRPPAE